MCVFHSVILVYMTVCATAYHYFTCLCSLIIFSPSRLATLAQLVGKDLGETVRRIMAALMGNKLAEKFNMTGKGDKTAFRALGLYGVIISMNLFMSKLRPGQNILMKTVILGMT